MIIVGLTNPFSKGGGEDKRPWTGDRLKGTGGGVKTLERLINNYSNKLNWWTPTRAFQILKCHKGRFQTLYIRNWILWHREIQKEERRSHLPENKEIMDNHSNCQKLRERGEKLIKTKYFYENHTCKAKNLVFKFFVFCKMCTTCSHISALFCRSLKIWSAALLWIDITCTRKIRRSII